MERILITFLNMALRHNKGLGGTLAPKNCFLLFRTGLWSEEKRYPQEVWEHACVSLFIPRCRDDMEIMPVVSNN